MPAVILAAVPATVLILCFASHNYVDRAAHVQPYQLGLLKFFFWFLALAFAFAPHTRRVVSRHLDALSEESGPIRWVGPLAVAVEFTLLLLFYKYCQYRGFQLPEDTAVMAQRAFNTLHGHWFHSSIYGVNYFAIHFAFIVDLLAPVLLLWRSAFALLAVQTLAIGSLGLGAYWLTYRVSKSSYAAFVAMMLTYASPAYSMMGTASLNDGAFLAPLLLWALVAWEYEKRLWCLVLLALAAATREHFPFSLGGLGVYFVFRNGRPNRRSLLQGAGIVAAAMLLWLGELKLIASFPRDWQEPWWPQLAASYGVSGQTFSEVLPQLLAHPIKVAVAMVYPFERVMPLVKLLLFAGFLPLAAPLQFIPFAVAVMPQMALIKSGVLHDMQFHYPSLVFALLMFAAAYGLARIYNWLKRRDRLDWLLPPALFVIGLGFGNSQPILMKNYQVEWFDAVPEFLSKIPPHSSLWVDEMLSAPVSTRRQLKLARYMGGFDMRAFSRELFRPDYVLLRQGWLAFGAADSRDPVLLFLANNRYERLQMGNDLVLLKAPDASDGSRRSPEAALPAPAPQESLAINKTIERLALERQGRAAPSAKFDPRQAAIGSYTEYLLMPNAAGPGGQPAATPR